MAAPGHVGQDVQCVRHRREAPGHSGSAHGLARSSAPTTTVPAVFVRSSQMQAQPLVFTAGSALCPSGSTRLNRQEMHISFLQDLQQGVTSQTVGSGEAGLKPTGQARLGPRGTGPCCRPHMSFLLQGSFSSVLEVFQPIRSGPPT